MRMHKERVTKYRSYDEQVGDSKIQKIIQVTELIVDTFNLPKDQIIVAGGALRSIMEDQAPKDYDIYFCSKNSRKAYLEEQLEEQYGVNNPKTLSVNQTFIEISKDGITVQLMYAKAPSEKIPKTNKMTKELAVYILDHFDFTVTKQGVYYEDGSPKFLSLFYFDNTQQLVSAIKDIKDRRLRMDLTMTLPIYSLMRIARYGSYGYILSREDADLFMEAFKRLDPEGEGDGEEYSIF